MDTASTSSNDFPQITPPPLPTTTTATNKRKSTSTNEIANKFKTREQKEALLRHHFIYLNHFAFDYFVKCGLMDQVIEVLHKIDCQKERISQQKLGLKLLIDDDSVSFHDYVLSGNGRFIIENSDQDDNDHDEDDEEEEEEEENHLPPKKKNKREHITTVNATTQTKSKY